MRAFDLLIACAATSVLLVAGCTQCEGDPQPIPEVPPSDLTGTWTGSMQIEFLSGKGGGRAPVLLLLLMNPEGGLTGTFSDPSCPGEPACPDGEALEGMYDPISGQVDMEFVFDCKTDLLDYHYSMRGAAEGGSISGTFETVDARGVGQSKGTWRVTVEGG